MGAPLRSDHPPNGIHFQSQQQASGFVLCAPGFLSLPCKLALHLCFRSSLGANLCTLRPHPLQKNKGKTTKLGIFGCQEVFFFFWGRGWLLSVLLQPWIPQCSNFGHVPHVGLPPGSARLRVVWGDLLPIAMIRHPCSSFLSQGLIRGV